MPHLQIRALTVALVVSSACLIACGDLPCPTGTVKRDDRCWRIDAGADASADAGDEHATDATVDSGSSLGVVNNPSVVDAGPASDASINTWDSNVADTGMALATAPDAASDAAHADVEAPTDAAPVAECDTTRPCAAGAVCSATKCVSACTQTQCDPNASCSLMGATPVCSCNGGYASVKDASGKVTCIRDLKCEELGCDKQNGECLGDTAQTRRCACKNGYTGDGKTCSPVSCPVPNLVNGRVSTPDGVTFGNTATFTCNGGYDFANRSSSITRMCGADKSWGAAVPKCEPRDCGPITVPYATVDTSRGTHYGDTPATVVCQHSFVRMGPATVECQADGNWSARPSCLGCGDKQVSNIPGVIQEECDPTAPNWNDWNCVGCTMSKMYLTCGGTNACPLSTTEDANGVWCYLGVCTRGCKSDSDCPSEPWSSSANAGCSGPSGGWCFVLDCATRADCPPGQGCQKSPGSRPFCMPCEGQNCF